MLLDPLLSHFHLSCRRLDIRFRLFYGMTGRSVIENEKHLTLLYAGVFSNSHVCDPT
jgi:hypothetical protein